MRKLRRCSTTHRIACCGAKTCCGPACISEAEDLTTLKWSFDAARAPCELEMLDTFEAAEDLLVVAVVLTSSLVEKLVDESILIQ